MPTFTLSGFQVNRDALDTATGVFSVDLNIVVPAGQETFTYSVLGTFPDGIPEVDINASDISVTASGSGIPVPGGTASLPVDSLTFLGFIESPEGVHTILSIEVAQDDGSLIELIFQIGGAALTIPTSLADFNALEASVDGIANFGTATGAFAPGAMIDFNGLANTVSDLNPTITGTAGDDALSGTAGDDYIATGNSTPNGDTVNGSTGNDTIDMFGNDGIDGFVQMDYSGMAGPLTVNIDGSANTGSVVKGADGTDTLLGVVQPLEAGWTNGGFAIVGTAAGDTFNLAPGDQQWMSVRGGAGIDSYSINGTGLVRLDFRDATQGIDVNLATGAIADDGFGNAETIGGTGALWEVQGSGFDDVFTGSSGDESYRAFGGNNTLDGGLGFDRLRYDRGTIASVNIDAENGVVNGTLSAGGTFTDTISGFERLRGSGGNDQITGEAGVDNRFEGRGGVDTFVHLGGADTISDFDPATETLFVRVAGLDQAAVDAAISGASDQGGSALVTFGSGTVLFSGVAPGDLLGADVRFVAPGAVNLVPGTDGDDNLVGTPGDDLITTGDNAGGDTGFDFVSGSTGNDTIDMSGITNGYVEIGYGGLDRIDAVIDGGANTGSVAKFAAGSAVGTDTLIDVENPLFSGFTIGGLSIRGTNGDDTFDVTPQGEQWMSIRAGAGTDSYAINGTGLVRLDFRDAAEAIEINLGNATGQIVNDGFGNTETITGTSSVWDIQGSGFDDVLIGSGRDESYTAFGGNNTLDGGGGFDRVRYDRETIASVNIDATAGTVTGTLDGGGTFTDTITGFEHLRGSDGNDQITGEASVDNLIEGQEGTDTFTHLGGNDTIADFDVANETLIVRIAGLDQAAVDAAIANATDVAASHFDAETVFPAIESGTVVDFGGGNTVSFGNLSAADLAGADVQFVAPGAANLVPGTDGDDVLVGTGGEDSILALGGNDFIDAGAGDDFINPGDNLGDSFGGDDFIIPGLGNDTIDFTDQVVGFVSVNYTFLDPLGQSITVDIDGGLNTGSVIYSGGDTDTLVNVINPLLSGFSTGGLAIRGTAGDDTFNVTPQGAQWMSVRLGDGSDTLNINGTGLVRVDFRTVNEGIDVNLETGVIANDGFGKQDTIIGSGAVWEVQGSDFNDVFVGSGRDESYRALGGNNTLDGDLGFDRLRYDRGTIASVNIDAENGVVNGTLSAGGTFTDTITGFEHLRGSGGNDQITGEAAVDNRYDGRGGTDTFVHLGGNDTISDFDPLTETLFVRVAGLDQAAFDFALNNSVSETPNGVFVDFGGGSTVLFAGRTLAEMGGANVQFVDPGAANLVPGTDGDDVLVGTAGDDNIITGNATPNGDFVGATPGDDTIDMSGNDGVNGFVTISYGGFVGGVNAVINGVSDTGAITKIGGGADTLINVANPLNAGFFNGGLGLVGSSGDDSFDVTLTPTQWMQIRAGEGTDSFTIGADGFVRLDFAFVGATQGAVVNLGLSSAQIANDGFGNTETISGPGNIWEVRGTENDDQIIGSIADESFISQGGDDTIDGGGGFDRLRYDRGGVGPVDADLTAGTVTGSWDGVGFSHTVSNIEHLRGSNSGDVLAGDAGDNLIDGRLGNDTLSGGGGDDTLQGGFGNDWFTIGAGVTTITDFELGTDVIDVRIGGLSVEARNTALQNAVDLGGGGASVDFGNGNTLRFDNLTALDVATLAGAEEPAPPPPPPTPIAWTVGDPHLLTLDGVGYDFHAIGEFVLLRGTSGGSFSDFEIQSRMGPVFNSEGNAAPNVSANIAIAARLANGTEVMIDAGDDSPLSVGGEITQVADGTFITVGTDRIFRDGDTYSVVFAGADGTVGDGDARLNVIVRGGFVDLSVQISADMAGQVEGLLGDGNGNPDNDIALANGTVLERPLAFEDLYGDDTDRPNLRDDWRVTDAGDSLFTYDAGETLAGFYDPAAPAGGPTDGVSPADLAAAQTAVETAGLTPGTLAFDNAVQDVLLTGDNTFILSSSGETAPTPENTGSAGTLAQGETRVTLNVSLTDEGGTGLDGAVVTFSAGGAPILGQAAGAGGSYTVGLGASTPEGRVDAVRGYEAGTDADIGVGDALDALRLAVGLNPSFGTADATNFIAADVNRDGSVGVGDALDILRFAVGLQTENAPRWVFLDNAQDLSGVARDAVAYDTGKDSGLVTDAMNLDLTGVLLGDLSAQSLAEV